MVIWVAPAIGSGQAYGPCPVCCFENVIVLVRGESQLIPDWNHPQTGCCDHLGKVAVNEHLDFIFLEDWEITAQRMGAEVFAYPFVNGVPEDILLRKLRSIMQKRRGMRL